LYFPQGGEIEEADHWLVLTMDTLDGVVTPLTFEFVAGELEPVPLPPPHAERNKAQAIEKMNSFEIGKNRF
jgi:hypothetical protein